LTNKKDDTNAPVALFSTFKNDAFGTPIQYASIRTIDLPLVHLKDYDSSFPIAAIDGKFTINKSIPSHATIGNETDPDNYNYILCPLSIFRKQWMDIFEVEALLNNVDFNGKRLFIGVLMRYKD
jgi:hypothetical protein